MQSLVARTRWWVVSTSVLLVALPMSPIARAEDVFAGKTVTLVVGYAPGGGYDHYARLLARHYGRHIPGSPNVVVQNMPGAASLQAARYLNATAPTDGTVMATFDPGLITDSLTAPEKVPDRFTDYQWIGAIVKDLRVCYTMATNPVKTWDDLLRAKEVVFGTPPRGSSNYKNSIILKSMFNAPIRIVSGYPGSVELRVVMERNEVDAMCGNWTAVPTDWIAEKKVSMLVKFSDTVMPGWTETVPYIQNIATTQDQIDILDVLFAAGDVGRPFAAPKKVPNERVDILRKGFDAAMKDEAVLADANKLNLPIDATTGADVAAVVDKIYKISKEMIDRAGSLTE